MIRIKEKAIGPREMWAFDKNIMRASGLDFNVDLNSKLPSNEEAYKLIAAKSQRSCNPTFPIEVDQKMLDDTFREMTSAVENLWGTKFIEKPLIELKEPKDYLPRINDIERKIRASFGVGFNFNSPPGMYNSQIYGIIIAPAKFLARVTGPDNLMQDTVSALSGKNEIKESLWDRPYFESMTAEMLSYVLFRQLRGEWKGNFLNCMNEIGNHREDVRRWNKVLAQHTMEQIALTGKNEWAPYVISDKIMTVWSDRYARRDYVGAEALLRKGMKLSDIAMVDGIESGEMEDILFANFNSAHPNHNKKLERFNSVYK